MNKLAVFLLFLLFLAGSAANKKKFYLDVIYDDRYLNTKQSDVISVPVSPNMPFLELKRIALESPEGKDYLKGRDPSTVKSYIDRRVIPLEPEQEEKTLGELRIDPNVKVVFKCKP